MNFDRKSGNNNGKLAEDSNSFPELPRIFDDRAQNDFTNHNSPAAHQDFAGGEYPSGAFPALDVAYPDQTLHKADGDFVFDNNVPAGSETDPKAYKDASYGGFRGQDRSYAPDYAAPQPQGGYSLDNALWAGGDEQSSYAGYEQREHNPHAADGYAMRREDFAANGSYAEDSFLRESGRAVYNNHEYDNYGQNGFQDEIMAEPFYGGPPNAHNLTRSEQIMTERRFAEDGRSRDRRADNPAGGQAGDMPQDMPFAEEVFHSGLSGDSVLQPAHFDPSDYDYNYDPQAEEQAGNNFAAQQNRAESAAYPGDEAYQRQNSGNAGYELQQNHDFFNPGNPEYREPVYEGGNHSSIQPGQGLARGYSLHAASYSGAEEQAYRVGSFAQSGGQGFAPSAAEQYMGQENPHNEMPAGDFAETGFDYAEPPYAPENEAPLPFMEDEGENSDLVSDFARLNADVTAIDRMAGDRMAGGFPSAGPEEMAAGRPPQMGHSREWGDSASPVNRQQNRPAAAGEDALFADMVSIPAQPKGTQSAAYAARNQDFAADTAYDDGTYDWAAPLAAGAVPPRRRPLPVEETKGRKALLLTAVLIVLTLVGAGLYWLFGGHQAIYSGGPVIIHKTAGDYKVKADSPVKNAADNQEQSVTEGVSGDNAAQAQQKTLIDKTETPVEMQKMEERLPFSSESRFDQSSVESLIKSAVAHATPVHIVPTVRVDADRKIVASAGSGAEKLLVPGGRNFVAEQNIMPGKAEKTAEGSAALPGKAAFASALPAVKIAEAPAVQLRKPAAAGAQTAQPAAAGGDYYMQISSQPSREAAEQSLRAAKKYLSEAAGDKIIIVPAAIPNKGTYYRVRIPAQSHEEAARLCEDYKQAGGHCFVAR